MELKINKYKQFILNTAIKAESKKWIDVTTLENIKSSLDTDELTIGFVGKMNMGKSSIINALIFEDDILPTSSTPMTVTLTSIKYGEQESATVTTIAEKDFEEICKIKDISDGSESAERIRSAKELYEAIIKIDNYKDLLGKTQVIEDLKDYEKYIGSNGKLSALTKTVVITLPKKELQGITIIDTPGFNDPISSRDDETFNFLLSANVIVLVQDPYSVFDITDMYLLESQISKAGIGKMLIAINRFDALGDISWKEELNKRITKKNKIIAETENDIVKELLTDCKMTPVSSIMALIGYLKKQGAEILAENMQVNFFYSKIQERFPELETANDYIQKSNILLLESEINRIVEDQKVAILLDAPLKKIKEILNSVLKNKENEVKDCENIIEDLKKGIPNIEKEKQEFRQFIEILFDRFAISTIQSTLLDSIRFVLDDLQSKRASLITGISNKSFPDPGRFDKQQKKVNHENIQRLYWDMDNNIRLSLNTKLNGKIRGQVEDEINDIIAYLTKHLPSNMKNIHGNFLKKLKDELKCKLQNIIISINTKIPDIPSNSTFRKQTAAMYYKNIFNQSYLDDYLNNFLSQFRTYAGQVKTDLEDVAGKLDREQKRVFDAANDENKSQQLIGEKENEKQTLNVEITEINTVLEGLNSITINVE